MIGGAFQEAVRASMDKSRRDREERERCPAEEDGCGRKGSLCTVSKSGVKLGSFCPHCKWSSFLFKGRRVRVEMRGGGASKKRKTAAPSRKVRSEDR